MDELKSFVGFNFYLDLSLSITYSRKKQVIQFIKDQKGIIDFSCSTKTNFFITTVDNIDDPENYKISPAIKNGAHIVEELFLFDCLDKNEILDFTTYRHILGTNNRKITEKQQQSYVSPSVNLNTSIKPLFSSSTTPITTTTTTNSTFTSTIKPISTYTSTYSSSSFLSSIPKYTPPSYSFNIKPISTPPPILPSTFSYTSLLKPNITSPLSTLSNTTSSKVVSFKSKEKVEQQPEEEEDFFTNFYYDNESDNESVSNESVSSEQDLFGSIFDTQSSVIPKTIINETPITSSFISESKLSSTFNKHSTTSETQKRKELLEKKKFERLELLNQKENQKKELLEQRKKEKELKLSSLNAEKEKRIEAEKERRKLVLETVKSKVNFTPINSAANVTPKLSVRIDKDKSGYENNLYLKQIKQDKKKKLLETRELEANQKKNEKELRRQQYLQGVEKEKLEQELEKQKALEAFLVRKAKREAKALLGEKPVVEERPDEDLRKIFVSGIDFKDIQENKKLKPKQKVDIQKKRLDALLKYMNNFGRVQKRNVFESHFFITYEDSESAAKAKTYFENIENRKTVVNAIKSQLTMLKLDELIAPNHKFYVKLVKSQIKAQKKETNKQKEIEAKIEQDKVNEELQWESQFDEWETAK